jgi:4-hydroxy-tetrahydrodipicolinate synthase
VIQLAPSALIGSYPPLVTPFSGGKVDYLAFERLVEHQVAGGSQGVVVTGTSGEPSVLTLDERAELVRVATGVAAGRVTVVAATGCGSYEETRVLSERAVSVGADALLVVTPFYMRPPQRGLVEYFVDLAGRVELPVLIYHIPGRAAVQVEPATLEAITSAAENVVGIKHASSDLGLITEALIRVSPEFRIFAGLEELSLPMLALGARGLMNAVGNLVPDRVAALWRAVEDQRLSDARKLHTELWELNRSVFFDINPIPIKYMLKRMGILTSNEHRLPMVAAAPDLERRLDAVLARAGLIG